MADLPTNYLDDILAVSMGGKRKFKITHENGSTEEVTIEDISDYDQVGSVFGAGDINRTNQAVNEKFDSGDVVDPMLTTEEGFAADAYKTKLQFDEQNKKLEFKKNGEITCNFVNNPVINSLKCTGNTVEIALKVTGEVTSTTTSIGTVPMDFRPKENAYILGRCIYDKTTWISLIYKITPDGNIYQAEYDNASITNIALAGSYCVL